MHKQIPNLHDPERTTTSQAAQRAERRARYASMTAEQIIQHMPDKELSRNAGKGGVLAVAEQERRMNEAMALHDRSPADMILADPELDLGV